MKTKKKTVPVVTILTTVGSKKAATTLADLIMAERLAACVQQVPIRSVYRWKGAIERASEILLIAKTRRDLAPRLAAFIRQHHTYELPEIVVLPITGGLTGYLRWIADETRHPASFARNKKS